MGRLIDADAFMQNLINCDIGRKSLEKVIEAVKKQSTAYDPDKVVEQLEEACISLSDYPGYTVDIEKAIEIVKGGGVDG